MTGFFQDPTALRAIYRIAARVTKMLEGFQGFFVHYRGKKRNVSDGVDIRRNMNYDYLNSTSTDIVSDEWPECFYRDACQSHDYW